MGATYPSGPGHCTEHTLSITHGDALPVSNKRRYRFAGVPMSTSMTYCSTKVSPLHHAAPPFCGLFLT